MMNNAEYHANRNHVSKSWLDKIAKSPATLKEYLDNPKQTTTPALEFGSLVHALVLEPDNFESEYIVQAHKIDKRTREGKIQYKEFMEEADGKKIISSEDMQKASDMKESIMRHRVASKLFKGGKAEQTVFFKDEQGCKCKARADYLRENCIVDLKTTKDASPSEFAKSVANYRYDVQQAHYCKAFNLDAFVFVAVEKEPPYLVGVYVIDAEAEERGERLRERDIQVYLDCVENDFWPGYADTIEEISLPYWSLNI